MKLELKPKPVIAESVVRANINQRMAVTIRAFWRLVADDHKRSPAGRHPMKRDAYIRHRYELGCKLLRENPRLTVAQMVQHLGISRSQWFRMRAKLS